MPRKILSPNRRVMPLSAGPETDLSRRAFVMRTLATASAAGGLGALMGGCVGAANPPTMNGEGPMAPPPAPGKCSTRGLPGPIPCGPLANIGELLPPDERGIRIPPGFSIRVIATTGETVPNTDFVWHDAPDGMATFATDDGGWILVCNQENIPGGVGAIRFDQTGEPMDAYRILDETRGNCAGGATPWGTWLSCEEIVDGLVYETDPYGCEPARALPALGAFAHEAVAVDPVNRTLYLTEDDGFGRLYRFRPGAADWPEGAERPLLEQGVLEALVIEGGNPFLAGNVTEPTAISWLPVPAPAQVPLSAQVPEATRFDGGEGIWYQDGLVFFSTKGTDQIWVLDIADPAAETIQTVYDPGNHPNPILSGVDNVTISCFGDVLVAEDGGDMQLVVLTPDGQAKPLIQFEGMEQSEVAGPCFSPDGSRLYCNSQWGYNDNIGITYELTGFAGLVAAYR